MSWNKTLEVYLEGLLAVSGQDERLRHSFAAFCELVDALGVERSEVERTLEVLQRSSAQPGEVLQAVLALADRPGGRASLQTAGALQVFVTLAAQGSYPAWALIRHPEELVYLTNQKNCDVMLGGISLAQTFLRAIEQGAADEHPEVRWARTLQVLRRGKLRESLGVFLCEVEGESSVRQTTADIADLAQACLMVAVEEGARVLGDASLADDFCVLGMGKLGGRELNYSSDVDLIYICADEVVQDPERRQQIDALARWVTAAMDTTTEDGYVFRVDLRLRPEGSLGALVLPVSGMLTYYLQWGRTWERSAMLKARAVAGNLALGKKFLEGLEPFLFRKYLDFSVIDDLRAMKQMVNENAQLSATMGLPTLPAGNFRGGKAGERLPDASGAGEPGRRSGSLKERLLGQLQSQGVRVPRASSSSSSGFRQKRIEESERNVVQNVVQNGARNPGRKEVSESFSPGWDVKIGVGGIREIEFFVQALQLVHCGTRPGLRVRSTLDALDRLLYAGLLSHEDHASLADAYDLFRRLEHRVQMQHDRQDHRLPADEEGFRALSARMGYSADRLREEIGRCRSQVSAMFGRLFWDSERLSDQPTVGEQRPAEVATVLAAPPDQLHAPAILAALRELGFQRPRQVAGQLQILREKSYGPFALHERFKHGELAAYLFDACRAAPDADQAFSFLTRLFTTVGDQPGYYRMLFENPHAARLLLHVFGSSRLLSNILLREPEMFERLVSVGTAAIWREREEISGELERRLRGVDDPDRRFGRMRRFQQEETLRIALHEIAGASSIEQTTRQLSFVAESVIDAALQEVILGLGARLPAEGRALLVPEKLPLVVLGMGKLGGQELSFGSDLDMIFVYEADEALGLDPVFFTRLAQRLIRALSSTTDAGSLYDVDMQLRPSGAQGTLVVSVGALEAYHASAAELWERQALLRARPLTGRADLRARVLELRAEFAFERALPEDARAQMLAMRAQMNEAAHVGSSGVVDIKLSPGGLVDIEFLTQYLQLRFGRDAAADDDARSQNTLIALRGLEQNETLRKTYPGLNFSALRRDYRYLRRVEARLRMSDIRADSRLPEEEEAIRVLARRLGFQGSQAGWQLRHELDQLQLRVRATYEEVFRT